MASERKTVTRRGTLYEHKTGTPTKVERPASTAPSKLPVGGVSWSSGKGNNKE